MIKNRRLLIQVIGPAVVIGLLLLATCVVSAWYIHRLQANLTHILSQNVTSLEAAQNLEIRARQLRFHSFLYLIDPKPERLEPIKQDEEHFQEALGKARQSSNTADQQRYVKAIEEGYDKYQSEMAQLRIEVGKLGSRVDLAQLADAHPIRHVVDPCQELFRINEEMMKETAQESDHVTRQAQVAMVLLGLLGSGGGLLLGYGMARGLSRSIYQLSVRVHDVARRLDEDVASVSVAVKGDIQSLDRQLDHILGRVEEVGERLQQHQREMLRAEQLAAVGQLAAGVAHEIRNPLTAVKMLIDAARRPKNTKPLTAEDLEVIHGEIARLEQKVQGFLDLARPPTLQRAPADMRNVIARAVELVAARARQQSVEIKVSCPDLAVVMDVDHNQICTVLVNLLLNSLDAMPRRGRLDIDLEVGLAKEVRLLVADTGIGIPPEMAGRLFTPFASTKPTGTGLGLSISRRIVEEHGGALTTGPPRQQGACFLIVLPATCSTKTTSLNGQAATASQPVGQSLFE